MESTSPTHLSQDSATLRSLRALVLGASTVFAIFLVLNLLVHPRPLGIRVGLLNLLVVALCGAVAALRASGRLDETLSHPAAAAILATCQISVLHAMWVLEDPTRTLSVCLILMANGCFLLKRAWFVAASIGTALSWGLVIPRVEADGSRIADLSFFVLAAGVMAWVVHSDRVSSLESTRSALRAVQMRDELLRQLADNIQKAFWSFEVEPGKFSYVSPGLEAVTGRSPDELYRDNEVFFRLFFEEDQVLAKELIRQVVEGGYIQTDHRLRHLDGSERWVHLQASLVTSDLPSGGTARRIVGVTEDITQRKRQEKEFERLATMDGLTAIANRRHFELVLRSEWKRHTRSEEWLSLLLIDVDHFKAFNDTYGHPAGDECLREIASVLLRSVRRSSDVAARFGGEEFALLLPQTNLVGGQAVAAEVHAQMRSVDLRVRGQAVKPPTLSIGIASIIPGRETRPGVLTERADRALYRAKENGRDQTVASDES